MWAVRTAEAVFTGGPRQVQRGQGLLGLAAENLIQYNIYGLGLDKFRQGARGRDVHKFILISGK